MGGWCQLAGAAVAIYLIPKSCETERWLATSYLAIHLITAPVSPADSVPPWPDASKLPSL